jgi:G3E family GTPase
MSIPLHLVTGFLGSGKTTFLMHYLNTFSKG